MNPPSYAQVVGVSSSPESHRNAVRVNTFAHGDGKDMRSIKHIFFLANHSRLDIHKTVRVHGNMFLFNYAGHPTVTSGVSPKTITNAFITTLPSPSDNHRDLTRDEVYERVNHIKNIFFGEGTPLSLYSHGDVIHDMIVLDGGEVFDDEMITNEHGVRTLKWNPASFLVYESINGNTYDLLKSNPQFKDVYEEHKSDFLVCHPKPHDDVCSTRYPPYIFNTREGERPVYLSDILDLMRERVRTAIVIKEPGPIRDDALEEKVSKYMDDHVVFINTGCRCEDKQYFDLTTGKRYGKHTRSVSTESAASSHFVNPTGATGKTATELGFFSFHAKGGRKLRKKIRTCRKLARRKYKIKTTRRKTKH